MATYRKWTETEDNVLYEEIARHPSNLHQCFLAVADRLDRSPGAVGTRWYQKVSKEAKYCCFITLSRQHKVMNRKNGRGVPSTANMFTRVVRLLRLL